MTGLAGHVAGLWRYPVKSLGGEPMTELRIDDRGVELDRWWALVDQAGGIASGKPTRRFRKVPGLLRHGARMDGEEPVITLADGRSARVGSAEAARLVREIAGDGWAIAREGSIPHFDAGAVHLVTSSTLSTLSAAATAAISVERLRPNVLIDSAEAGLPEDGWVGRTIRIGEVELRITGRTERCVMVNHARATLPARRDVLKTIGAVNRAYAGVYADVVTPGAVRLGDAVSLT